MLIITSTGGVRPATIAEEMYQRRLQGQDRPKSTTVGVAVPVKHDDRRQPALSAR